MWVVVFTEWEHVEQFALASHFLKPMVTCLLDCLEVGGGTLLLTTLSFIDLVLLYDTLGGLGMYSTV